MLGLPIVQMVQMKILEYCCDNGYPAYVDAGLCGDSGDDSADSTVVVDPVPCVKGLVIINMFDSWGDGGMVRN